MYYTIYKITNQIDGKIYIGAHKTENLNDNYMGSGKYLKRAQIKYGIENFSKEILYIFDSPEPMYAKEAEIVNEEFLAFENTYNLKVGGFGGFDHINSKSDCAEYIEVRRENGRNSKNLSVWPEMIKINPDLLYANAAKAKRTKEANSEEKYGDPKECYRTFKGKSHTEETKRKIGDSSRKHQLGTGNSQYGTRWIHSKQLKISKRILKTDPLPDGWEEGRKMKF